MRRFLSRGSALALAVALLVSGCGRGSGKTRVAFISNNNFEFWVFAQRGAEKAQADLGNIEVEFKMPAKGNAEEQQQIIEDLLLKGVKGIAISPNDAKNMSEFFKNKVSGKVALLTVDSDVPDPKVRRGYLGTHNYRAGRAVGELVAKAVPEGGKIAIFVGAMDVTNAVERRQGVLDFLAGIDSKEMSLVTPADTRGAKFGKYVLVDTRIDDRKPTACQEMAEDLLAKNPDVAAVVGLWAYNPPALLRAAEKMKSKTAIIGFDEDDETLGGIQSGKIFGTVVQSPFEFGNQSMRILAALAKGDEGVFKNYPGIDAEKRIYIDHRVIDQKNVEAFRAEVKTMLRK